MISHKGQIFSTDLILAIVILLFIITSTAVYSSSVSNRLFFLEQDFEMRQAGQQAANALILTRGSPGNWQNENINDINSIGLANSENILNKEKMEKLSALASSDYETVKEILGLAKVDFAVQVKSLQSNVLVESFGQQTEQESRVVSINRFAFYDGNNVVVTLKVFE